MKNTDRKILLDGARTSGRFTSVICVLLLFFLPADAFNVFTLAVAQFNSRSLPFCLPVTDLQFSQTIHGRPVPFATAGDCYSAAKCPQVGRVKPYGYFVLYY